MCACVCVPSVGSHHRHRHRHGISLFRFLFCFYHYDFFYDRPPDFSVEVVLDEHKDGPTVTTRYPRIVIEIGVEQP